MTNTAQKQTGSGHTPVPLIDTLKDDCSKAMGIYQQTGGGALTMSEIAQELVEMQKSASELQSWATSLANHYEEYYRMTGNTGNIKPLILIQWQERDHSPENKWGEGWTSPEQNKALIDALKDTLRIIQGWDMASPIDIAESADKARAALALAGVDKE